MAIITLDPGHGGTEEIGGSSPNNAVGPQGTLEKNLVLDVGLRTRARLESDGHRVIMTRDSDVNLGLADRAAVAHGNDADVFVSIHFNGYHDPEVQGTETFVYPHSDAKNHRLASAIQARMLACTGYRDRGVKSAAYGVIKSSRHLSKTATCLLEVSFITDPGDEERLQNEGYRRQIAEALADGIGDSLKYPAPAGLTGDAIPLFPVEAVELEVLDGDA